VQLVQAIAWKDSPDYFHVSSGPYSLTHVGDVTLKAALDLLV